MVIITTEINNLDVKTTLVDYGSSRDVLFLKLEIENMEKNLIKVDLMLIGLAGRITYPFGSISLPVVDALNSYNVILGALNCTLTRSRFHMLSEDETSNSWI